jgi:alcohol dehydrogenase class IV
LLGDRLQAGDACAQTEQFVSALAELGPRCGLPARLRDAGVPADSLEQLASDAMLQQRLLVNNPRAVNEADALAIYRAAY